jgi:hypothetical protein
MSFAHRAKFDGCPFCTNRRVSQDNNLLALYPKIAKEWHPSKNGALNPSDVVHGYSKPVWWICGYGHEWKVSPSSRTLGLTGCPKCSIQTSREELRIYTELHSIFGEVTHRYKIRGIEADIYLPKYGICIEYDGSFYHRDKTEIDIKKNEELRSLGLKVIRVREGLDKTQDMDVVTEGVKITKKDIHKLLMNLALDKHDRHLADTYLREESFRGDEELKYLLSFLPAPPPSNSLEHLDKDISNEWNYEKNLPLLPSNFKPGSGKVVWWKCKIGHEWSAPIARRTGRQKSGCPYCSNKKVNLESSLEVTHPEIAHQWHPTKNVNLLSSQITAGSSKKVWWKCIKGHEWLSPVKSRTHAKGCPFCTSRKICEDNNLAVLNPELATEWHPTKNFPLKPNDVGKGSHKKVWWICSENHEWLAAIHSRTRGHGCPICSRTLQPTRATKITVEGTTYPSMSSAAKAFSISTDTITRRLKAGWSIEKALKTKPRSSLR